MKKYGTMYSLYELWLIHVPFCLRTIFNSSSHPIPYTKPAECVQPKLYQTPRRPIELDAVFYLIPIFPGHPTSLFSSAIRTTTHKWQVASFYLNPQVPVRYRSSGAFCRISLVSRKSIGHTAAGTTTRRKSERILNN
jgi:hypothetical protein